LSNNAWFGDSSMPRQHLGASVLRAVENRMPVIHVMNNGPSAVISGRGQYLFRSGYGERVGYLVDVPVPERRLATFYQVVPWFTPALLLTLGGLLVLATLAGRRRAASNGNGL
jgi:apolipoprotein N-acyltransferase